MWSPKGDRIAFSVRRASGDKVDVYTMNIDGGEVKRLTFGQGNSEDPAWSPDGSHIAFTSNRTGSAQIWVMNADGGNQVRLTSGGASHSPTWGPFAPR